MRKKKRNLLMAVFLCICMIMTTVSPVLAAPGGWSWGLQPSSSLYISNSAIELNVGDTYSLTASDGSN